MKHVIQNLTNKLTRRRLVGEDTKRLPSLVKAMKALVPRSVMREVVASSPDRRQWGVLAAAWVGVSEREFVSAAARELHMPYQDHVPAPDLTVFGAQGRSMLSSLRKVGAAVLLQDRRVVGFVATDPAEVRGLELYDGTQAISMAPWTEIAKALDMAERMIAETEANGERTEAVQRKEMCDKVLDILITEAVRHGAATLEIVTTDGKSRYQFTTVEGKIAVGSIHEQALQSLLPHLRSLDGNVFSHPSVGKVLVRTLGNDANVRLSWSPPQTQREIAWREPETASAPTERESSAAAPAPIDEDRVESAPQGEQVPVLVVDDNPMFCRVVERLLKRENFDVSFEDSGKAALERLQSVTTYLPKVIICDLHMPQMNGKELIEKLKADARFKNIPVIMLTSDDGVDAELIALEVGADALVSKSKDPRVLCAQVVRLAKGGSLREAA